MRWPIVPLAMAIAGAQLIDAQQQPQLPFTTTANLVVVPAVVLDRRGQPVTDLTADDFQVSEDGEPMAIEAFAAPAPSGAGADGRLLVLVLDNVNSPPELGARIRRIAGMFVDRMTPADTMSVVALDGGRGFTTDNAKELRAAIDRFRPSANETILNDSQRSSSGLRAITDLSDQLAKTSHRRKAIVVIGHTALFSPASPSAFDNRPPELGSYWFDAVRTTARNNVSLYAIDPAGFTGSVNGYAEGFADETGGQAYTTPSNFDKVVGEVWRDAGTYYLLGYAAPVNDHRLHKIEVQVRKPGLTVRARRGRG